MITEEELLEATEPNKLYQKLTGGDDSKGYRMITWLYLPIMVIGSFFGFVFMLISVYWLDINITVFPIHDGFVMGSSIVLIVVAIIQFSVTFVQLNLGKGFFTQQMEIMGMKKVKRQFSIASITMLVIVIILLSSSSIYGFNNYRSRQYIYIQPEGDYRTFSGSFENQSLIFEGIVSFQGDVEIKNSTISFESSSQRYGIIVEKNCSLSMVNVSFNGGDPDRVIFDVIGSINAAQCEFSNIRSLENDRMSGIKIYNKGNEDASIFDQCIFRNNRGIALLIQRRNVSVMNCHFIDTGSDSIRAHFSDMIIMNTSFKEGKRAVSLFRSDFLIYNCAIEDIRMGIYSEDSTGSINDCIFRNISSYAIEFYRQEPEVNSCSFQNCGDVVKELDHLGYQISCFLVIPLLMIIFSVISIIIIILTNRITEKRLNKTLKKLPDVPYVREKKKDLRIEWRKNYYVRWIFLFFFLLIVVPSIVTGISVKVLLNLAGPELCQLSLSVGAMIFLITILPGLIINVKRKGTKYYPSSFYPLDDGFVIRFAGDKNYKIAWSDVREARYNEFLNILTVFLDKQFDGMIHQIKSKKGDGFSLTIKHPDREGIKRSIRELNLSNRKK